MEIRDYRFQFHKHGTNDLVFEVSDEKVDSGDSNIRYYGYLSYYGSWIIMEWNNTDGTYRYKSGQDNYAANWVLRESLTYGYYNAL